MHLLQSGGGWPWFRTLRVALLVGAAILIVFEGQFAARADTMKTVDGQIYRGSIQLTNDAFSMSDTNGESFEVPIPKLESAVFADAGDVIAGEQTLSSPWASQDIGSVGIPGGARQTTNSFAVRASGVGLNQSVDGFHFIYQPMSGDGEIVARIAGLDSKFPQAEAGLMIRQTLGPESAHAAVVLSLRNAPAFHYRVSRKRPNPEMRGPPTPAARWLKLEKREKFYIGSVSEDGKNWKVVGSQTINLGSSRNRDDQWFIGLAVSSHTNNGLCAAQFEQVSWRLHGIKAELFSDEFKTPIKTLILSNLPEVARSWEEDRPSAVRWTGQLIPQYTDRYSFSVRSSDAAKLWIGDKLVYSSMEPVHVSVSVERGQPVNLKMESRLAQAKRFSATILWAGAQFGTGAVLGKDLLPYSAGVREDSVENRLPDVALGRAQAAVAGIVLKNGTVLAGIAKEGDDSVFKFQPTGQSAMVLNAIKIARVQFRSMSPHLARRIVSSVPGVLLVNGDFIEGEFKGLSKGRVQISSVIFGLRSYGIATEATAVVLRPFQKTAKFIARTNTGSALFADGIEVQNGQLVVSEPLLGNLRFTANQLLDVRRVSASK